jgi:hypothetical protein
MTMQLSIDRTDDTVRIDGLECRRWKGTGPDGCGFLVWVARCNPMDERAVAYAEANLSPVDPPGRIVPVTVSLSADELRACVARWIVDTWGTIHESRTQASMMRLVKTAHEDGEDAVALSLVLLMAARSSGIDGEALSALSLALGDLGVDLPTEDATAANAERPAGG